MASRINPICSPFRFCSEWGSWHFSSSTWYQRIQMRLVGNSPMLLPSCFKKLDTSQQAWHSPIWINPPSFMFSCWLRQKMHTYKPEYTKITLLWSPRRTFSYVEPFSLTIFCWESVHNTAAYEQWAIWWAEVVRRWLLRAQTWEERPLCTSADVVRLVDLPINQSGKGGAGCCLLFTNPAEHVKEVCWWPSQKYRPACETIATSCRCHLKIENLMSDQIKNSIVLYL